MNKKCLIMQLFDNYLLLYCREVITIQQFLEAAAQHEMCGKVRLRRFIENLLRRISLAERLLEYYQSAPHRHYCTAHSVCHQHFQNNTNVYLMLYIYIYIFFFLFFLLLSCNCFFFHPICFLFHYFEYCIS